MSLPAVVIPFQFEMQEVRTVDRDGNLWWVLADICRILEVGLASDAAKRLDEDEKGMDSIHTLGGIQEMTIISLPGLFKLIQTSRKPAAKRLDRWVRHDVLMQIHNTGSYVVPGSDHPLTEQSVKALLAPIHQEMQESREFRQEMREFRDNVIGFQSRGRKDISVETDRSHLSIIEHDYNGFCPCECGRKLVADGDWTDECHIHHQNGAHRNSVEDTIPVCIPTHKRIENSPHDRLNFAKIFADYQHVVKLRSWRKPKQLKLI